MGILLPVSTKTKLGGIRNEATSSHLEHSQIELSDLEYNKVVLQVPE